MPAFVHQGKTPGPCEPVTRARCTHTLLTGSTSTFPCAPLPSPLPPVRQVDSLRVGPYCYATHPYPPIALCRSNETREHSYRPIRDPCSRSNTHDQCAR